MPYYCTVPRCTSMSGKVKNVSFHRFPRDEELAQLWNKILKRGKPYTKYSKVCSLHFKPEDYTVTSLGRAVSKGQFRSFLRKDAIPSVNLPSDLPVPYKRQKNATNGENKGTTNAMDSQMQQQLAQAIYMRTILALQSACLVDSSVNNDQQHSEDEEAHYSNNAKQENELTIQHMSSFKCSECTKCFKDPDVFKLHLRTHKKDNEKENFSSNAEETLKSNPILANLLMTRSAANFGVPSNGEQRHNVDSDILALAVHFNGYLKSMVSNAMIMPLQPDLNGHKSEGDISDSEDLLEENL